MCSGALAKGSKWRRNTKAFSSRSIDPTLTADSQCGGLLGLSANPVGSFQQDPDVGTWQRATGPHLTKTKSLSVSS